MAPALDRGDDGSAEPHARTPAQRYAQFRDRESHPEFTSFRALYDFEFDDFQVQACTALNEGNGVLVAAPTGSGKTVVGEFAVHLALERGLKCFYTTPIKALSNQKYADLVRRYDSRTVGLLTGDNSVNGEAPIVVMTTEVLRNMLYAGSATLKGLGYVVLDEVHYLADRSRGAVWEEVIIHLPESVRVVALSATVSNAEEFGDWLDDLRGGVTVIVDEHRPVPLWQHMMAGNRLYDLFTDPAGTRVNPELMRMEQRHRGAQQQVPVTGRSRPARGGRRGHPGGRSGRGRAGHAGGRSKYADGYAGRSGGGPSPGPGRAGRPTGPRSSPGSTRPGCCRPSNSSSAGRAATRRSSSAWPPGCGSPSLTRPSRSPSSWSGARRTSPTRTSPCSATGTGSPACSGASPHTTPACSPPSRRWSRSCSRPGSSVWCSPPRRSRWASTCRPGPSSSRSWTSGTARRTPS